jgi:hypothetical protein
VNLSLSLAIFPLEIIFVTALASSYVMAVITSDSDLRTTFALLDSLAALEVACN